MEAAKERPHRTLHKFSLLHLKWGNARLLRCMKIDPSQSGETSLSTSSSDTSQPNLLQKISTKPLSPSSISSSIEKSRKLRDLKETDGAEGDRDKLVILLQTPNEDKEGKSMIRSVSPDRENDEEMVKPWNLRKRRAVCRVPREKEPVQLNSASVTQENVHRSLRLRGLDPDQTEKREERQKLSISLSRKEIEEDFFAMTGSRPHRRPKKRARVVQKQLDAIFPGLWLYDVTADSYKVPDIPDSGKR